MRDHDDEDAISEARYQTFLAEQGAEQGAEQAIANAVATLRRAGWSEDSIDHALDSARIDGADGAACEGDGMPAYHTLSALRTIADCPSMIEIPEARVDLY